MKIGIITELSHDSFNFGNHLQAYALNQYLQSAYPKIETETILYSGANKKRYASPYYCMRTWIRGLYRRCMRKIHPVSKGEMIEKRHEKFLSFDEQNIRTHNITRWTDMVHSCYDLLIAGSDIVWLQYPGFIRRIKFLDFGSQYKGSKIAYAASFGKSGIPEENVKLIKKSLAGFKAVSVREKTAADQLKSIGISEVVPVCDPTLLLAKTEWERLEIKPAGDDIADGGKIDGDGFCFAYLLGQDRNQRDHIEALCRREGLQLITVPYISGYRKDGSDVFGDVKVINCGPREWLWLIDHAQYMITDSFHGLVFSTVFSTKFIVVSRMNEAGLNVRMKDYLHSIGEENKFVDIGTVDHLNEFVWDFDHIGKRLDASKKISKDFLQNNINFDYNRRNFNGARSEADHNTQCDPCTGRVTESRKAAGHYLPH